MRGSGWRKGTLLMGLVPPAVSCVGPRIYGLHESAFGLIKTEAGGSLGQPRDDHVEAQAWLGASLGFAQFCWEWQPFYLCGTTRMRG